ncbi:uncharacterized protein [Lolium perenne]|uniref:uncharacterized protein n=1 Tax=Lolium perenne TaxID=4522 RepID=UPI0021EA3788|nr:uncharacterized protein LOC127325767 [Lolium perenne]
MKQPAASPGRAEKQQQQLPAPPGLARLLLSKSRRGGRSRRAPATSPMFVSRRSRAAAGADGEPSSPKVTCIGQVRMRKGKKGGKKGPSAPAPARASTPEKARGYCRCLKKAFLCGGLFGFDRGGRKHKAPSPVSERSRRSPWVFSSRDVAVAAAPKQPDPRSDRAEEEDDEEMGVGVGVFCSVETDEGEEPGINSHTAEEVEEAGEVAELASSATTTPPKNALLLMRCRSAPQNRTSPLTARFAAANAPSPVQETVEITPTASARASPSPRKPEMVPVERDDDDKWQEMLASAAQEQQEQQEARAAQEDESDDYDEEEEAEELRCSSARPLVLPRCKSEPATTAAAKMAAGIGSEAAPSGCFWAHGGGSGRRRHAPPLSPVSAAPVALTGH